MSKPVFSDLFKFSGRRNRQSYILLLLAQLAVALLIGVLIAVGAAIANTQAPFSLLLFVLSGIGFIGLCISGWAGGSQRIRDFGHSGVWILLVLVPYVGWLVSLAICFVPSDAGENKYGPSCI